jgi:hypothetical protein
VYTLQFELLNGAKTGKLSWNGNTVKYSAEVCLLKCTSISSRQQQAIQSRHVLLIFTAKRTDVGEHMTDTLLPAGYSSNNVGTASMGCMTTPFNSYGFYTFKATDANEIKF